MPSEHASLSSCGPSALTGWKQHFRFLCDAKSAQDCQRWSIQGVVLFYLHKAGKYPRGSFPPSSCLTTAQLGGVGPGHAAALQSLDGSCGAGLLKRLQKVIKGNLPNLLLLS